MDARTTGKIICAKRKELNLTQKELADMVGVSNRAVSKWETGEGYPDISLLPELSAALQISIDELLTGTKPEPTVEGDIASSKADKVKNARGKLLVAEVIAFVLAFASDAIGCGTELYLYNTMPFFVFIEIYLLVLSVLLFVVSLIVFFTSLIKYKFEADTISRSIALEAYAFTILSLIMPIFAGFRLLHWYSFSLSYIFILIVAVALIIGSIAFFMRFKKIEKGN